MTSLIFRSESWNSRKITEFPTWNSELDDSSNRFFPVGALFSPERRGALAFTPTGAVKKNRAALSTHMYENNNSVYQRTELKQHKQENRTVSA